MDKTDDLIDLLSKQNLRFKAIKHKDVFRVPVTKQITLFYRNLENKDIELLRFWNTYQNTDKFKL